MGSEGVIRSEGVSAFWNSTFRLLSYFLKMIVILAFISVMIWFVDWVHRLIGEFLEFNHWVTFIYLEKYSYPIRLHHIGFYIFINFHICNLLCWLHALIDWYSSKFYESACAALFTLSGLIGINTSITGFIDEYVSLSVPILFCYYFALKGSFWWTQKSNSRN